MHISSLKITRTSSLYLLLPLYLSQTFGLRFYFTFFDRGLWILWDVRGLGLGLLGPCLEAFIEAQSWPSCTPDLLNLILSNAAVLSKKKNLMQHGTAFSTSVFGWEQTCPEARTGWGNWLISFITWTIIYECPHTHLNRWTLGFIWILKPGVESRTNFTVTSMILLLVIYSRTVCKFCEKSSLVVIGIADQTASMCGLGVQLFQHMCMHAVVLSI